jgi:hypothetical protein
MKWFGLIPGLMFVCLATTVHGQKPVDAESYGMFQTRDEYHHFMGAVKQTAAGDAELQSMIGLINDIVLNQPIGSTDKQYGGTSSTPGLLADPGVRDEIGMMDDQYHELQELNSDIRKRMGDRLREIDFSDSKSAIAQIRDIQKQADQDLNSVLLPHQVQRLRQIRIRSQLRQRSLVDLLTSDPLKSELEISDDQSQQLKQAEQEIQEELAREIAKLQESARKKLLSKLNRSQQERVEEIFGAAFEFQRPSKRDR